MGWPRVSSSSLGVTLPRVGWHLVMSCMCCLTLFLSFSCEYDHFVVVNTLRTVYPSLFCPISISQYFSLSSPISCYRLLHFFSSFFFFHSFFLSLFLSFLFFFSLSFVVSFFILLFFSSFIHFRLFIVLFSFIVLFPLSFIFFVSFVPLVPSFILFHGFIC